MSMVARNLGGLLLALTALLPGCGRESLVSGQLSGASGGDSFQDAVDTASQPDGAAEICPEDLGAEADAEQGTCVLGICAADAHHAPDPSTFGPFPVGVKTFTTERTGFDGQPRTLTVEVWYPTTEAFRDGPFEWIDLREMAPDEVRDLMPDAEIPPIETTQVRDADLRRDGGPYPLLVFSHGAFGIRFQSIFFTLYLASHGYVVAAPDHTGETLYDMILTGYDEMVLPNSAMNRPGDMMHVIDAMLAKNADPEDFFAGSIDPDAIATSGHSFGGFTCLMAAFEDPRVKAVIPMAPLTSVLAVYSHYMDDLPVPLLMMAGGLDNTIPDVKREMRAAYDKAPPPKWFFELLEGGHFTFTDICQLDLARLANEIGIDGADSALEDGCADYNVPVSIAHPLIRRYAIGFLNVILRGSDPSRVYIDERADSGLQGLLITATEP